MCDKICKTSKVIQDCTDYVFGMFLSVGVRGGLSKFSKIEQIYNHNVAAQPRCCYYDSWYVEYLRSLSIADIRLSMYLQSDLKDIVPLTAHKTESLLLLIPSCSFK